MACAPSRVARLIFPERKIARIPDDLAWLCTELEQARDTIRNFSIGWQERHERDVEVNKELERARARIAELEGR